MSTHENTQSETDLILHGPLFIYREDKNLIPMNFAKNALSSWEHFGKIQPNSITRVGQGFSLRCMFPNSLPIPDSFELSSIKYSCKRPSKIEKHLGEITIFLSDPTDFEV